MPARGHVTISIPVALHQRLKSFAMDNDFGFLNANQIAGELLRNGILEWEDRQAKERAQRAAQAASSGAHPAPAGLMKEGGQPGDDEGPAASSLRRH